jgi:hypothetical protein
MPYQHSTAGKVRTKKRLSAKTETRLTLLLTDRISSSSRITAQGSSIHLGQLPRIHAYLPQLLHREQADLALRRVPLHPLALVLIMDDEVFERAHFDDCQ